MTNHWSILLNFTKIFMYENRFYKRVRKFQWTFLKRTWDLIYLAWRTRSMTFLDNGWTVQENGHKTVCSRFDILAGFEKNLYTFSGGDGRKWKKIDNKVVKEAVKWWKKSRQIKIKKIINGLIKNYFIILKHYGCHTFKYCRKGGR